MGSAGSPERLGKMSILSSLGFAGNRLVDLQIDQRSSESCLQPNSLKSLHKHLDLGTHRCHWTDDKRKTLSPKVFDSGDSCLRHDSLEC